MNRQEVFDKVVKHADEQGCKALSTTNACMYRTESGRTCFIGALIPDKLYDPSMEGNGIGDVFVEFPSLQVFFDIESSDDISFLILLQNIHDNFDICNWHSRFNTVAIAYNLKYN